VVVLRKEPEPESVAAKYNPLAREAFVRFTQMGLIKSEADKLRRVADGEGFVITRGTEEFTIKAASETPTTYEMRDSKSELLAAINLLVPRYETASTASPAIPNEPLPPEVPVAPEVVQLVESHPFFAHAPPISLATYTLHSLTTSTTSGGAGASRNVLTMDTSVRRLRKTE
jgi:hypothetical protein